MLYLPAMYKAWYEPHDIPDEKGIRSVCEDRNMKHLVDTKESAITRIGPEGIVWYGSQRRVYSIQNAANGGEIPFVFLNLITSSEL